MPSNHLILCRPLCLLPSIFPSIRVYSNESALRIRWSKYWCISISPSDEYSGLISFRMDWLDLLAVQGTLKSLLQHHSSKASIIQQRHTGQNQWSAGCFQQCCVFPTIQANVLSLPVSLSFSLTRRISSTFVNPGCSWVSDEWMNTPVKPLVPLQDLYPESWPQFSSHFILAQVLPDSPDLFGLLTDLGCVFQISHNSNDPLSLQFDLAVSRQRIHWSPLLGLKLPLFEFLYSTDIKPLQKRKAL